MAKQFRPIGGVPILLRAVRPFLAHPAVGTVVAVLPPEIAATPPEWLAELAGERLLLAAGSDSRTGSVAAGLAVLPSRYSVVLVHDAVRPFPSAAVIDAVIAGARLRGAAIAALPVFDTLKEAEPGGALPGEGELVARTIARSALWRAQTPQGFSRDLLARALARAADRPVPPTDEAQLVEEMGEPVLLIRDSIRNFKITTEDEFQLAEQLAALAP